ncbi:MAG: hypothetical protein WCP08_03215 [Prolixibacteraceae bacterium]
MNRRISWMNPPSFHICLFRPNESSGLFELATADGDLHAFFNPGFRSASPGATNMSPLRG